LTYSQPILIVFFVVALAGILRKNRRLALAGVLGLGFSCWPPVEWLLSRPLEMAYPVRPFQPGDEQAIVVFAGGVDRAGLWRPYPEANQDTVERSEYAAWVYRLRPLPVLACGGAGTSHDPPFSHTVRELLRQSGVPEDRIWTEERSLNTHENALYGAEILRRHGIRRVVLVVDARSMPRAAACLRKEGIEVTPAPSKFREWDPWREEIFPDWKGLKGNENTLHEVVGLLWYRLRGWI
jgi:uncharacterized SAM-binding protein YcdF (DUF218 family)